jgi:hypothetical protein
MINDTAHVSDNLQEFWTDTARLYDNHHHIQGMVLEMEMNILMDDTIIDRTGDTRVDDKVQEHDTI